MALSAERKVQIDAMTPEQRMQRLEELKAKAQSLEQSGFKRGILGGTPEEGEIPISERFGMGARRLIKDLPSIMAGQVPKEEEVTATEWKPTTKEEAIDFEREKQNIKGKNIASPEGLTSEQQITARALAKKMYGVRGAEFGLPAIYEEMRKGKSVDEIEDVVRYKGQSGDFSSDLRNAAQSILMNTSENKSQKAMDYIDDLYSKGDIEGTKNQLKRLARTQASPEESRFIVGKERTIKLLDEIQSDLNSLEKMGTNTNIFTGTQEQIASKIGTVKNPEARKITTKIATALQNYRRSMTGVQFGMPENLEYKIMFPSIGRTANFNTANITALKEVLSGDLDNFYALSMGEKEYNTLFKNISGDTQSKNTNKKEINFNTIEEANKAIENLSSGTIITVGNQKFTVGEQ